MTGSFIFWKKEIKFRTWYNVTTDYRCEVFPSIIDTSWMINQWKLPTSVRAVWHSPACIGLWSGWAWLVVVMVCSQAERITCTTESPLHWYPSPSPSLSPVFFSAAASGQLTRQAGRETAHSAQPHHRTGTLEEGGTLLLQIFSFFSNGTTQLVNIPALGTYKTSISNSYISLEK